MTKRTSLRVLTGLVLLGALAALGPSGYWQVNGWINGMPIYQGRPADWWAAEVEQTYHAEMRTSVSYVWVQRRLSPWKSTANRWLGLGGFAEEVIQPPPLVDGDSAALPVLEVLLRDQRSKVRQLAADGLGQMKTELEAAQTLLRGAADDPDPVVRHRVANALYDLSTRTAADAEPR